MVNTNTRTMPCMFVMSGNLSGTPLVFCCFVTLVWLKVFLMQLQEGGDCAVFWTGEDGDLGIGELLDCGVFLVVWVTMSEE